MHKEGIHIVMLTACMADRKNTLPKEQIRFSARTRPWVHLFRDDHCTSAATPLPGSMHSSETAAYCCSDGVCCCTSVPGLDECLCIGRLVFC